jgi:competence protein ComEC
LRPTRPVRRWAAWPAGADRRVPRRLPLFLALFLAACGPGAGTGAPADGAAAPQASAAAEAAQVVGVEPQPGDTALQVPQGVEPLVIHFLDVGQGDAVLIRSPSGQNVLYDGGDRGVDVLGMVRRLGVERLDLVIASHNHADHIGGLPPVIRALRPRFAIDNGVPHTTRSYEQLLEAIEASGAQLLEPERRTIRLGEAEIEVVPPPGQSGWGHNNNSVGLRVRFGEFHASMFGDAEERQFAWLLENHRDLLGPVHVHKASHHASRNGDTPEAIRLLRPQVVVIGLADGNTYGHPHREALALYRSVDARIFRTDQHGAVRFEAYPDGQFRVTTERGAPADCVDINRAPPQQLTRVLHVDAERADQIVRLRGERPFRSVGELTRVHGIGAARAGEIAAQGLACVP